MLMHMGRNRKGESVVPGGDVILQRKHGLGSHLILTMRKGRNILSYKEQKPTIEA